MGKRIDIVLYDNYNGYDDSEVWNEAYEEFLELNGLSETEYSFEEFISEEMIRDWNDLKCNLKYSKNNTECVIVGSLGLWNGRKIIVPMKQNSVWDAICKCVANNDYCIVKQINGHVEVTSIHHDGRNEFEIHLLNEKGINASENANLNNRCYYKAIKNYIF